MMVHLQAIEWGKRFNVKSRSRVPSNHDFVNQNFEVKAQFQSQFTEEELNNPQLMEYAFMTAFSQENPDAIVSWYRLEVLPLIALDINGDGVVDQRDVEAMQPYYGTQRGMAGYYSALDFNQDGRIDIKDIAIIQYFVDHPITHGFSYICLCTLRMQGYGTGIFISPWILALLIICGTIVIGLGLHYGYEVWLDIVEFYQGPEAPDPPAPPTPEQFDLDGDGVVSPQEYEQYLLSYADYLKEYKGYQEEYPWATWIPAGIAIVSIVAGAYVIGNLMTRLLT